jgi:prepilin-type N-terminal cleavage/methylation domain-containing protein
VNKLIRNKTSQKGFTLIELLVVIAIIGLLASVVLLSLNSARQKSRDAKRLADMRQLASALELYYNDYSGYPLTANLTAGLQPNYIGALPTAPTPADGSCAATTNAYTYASTSGTTYSYIFCLGAVTGGYSAGSRTLSPAGIQ